MPVWLIVILTMVFKAVLDNVSDPIRERVVAFVKDLEKRAKETPNVFDDMLVDLLKKVLAINDD